MKHSSIPKNVNFIYTYKSEFGETTKFNELCLIDIICLCISAIKLKKKFNNKIILYTDKFLIKFLSSLDIFDKIIFFPDLEIIKTQNPGKYSKNTLYKLFVIKMQKTPFIHIDNDLFINNASAFKNLDKKIFFSYEEHIKPSSDFYYDTYFNTLIKVSNKLEKNSSEMNEFTYVESAANCSIIGDLTGNTLSKSFEETILFYEKNRIMLNQEENMQMFLEQYYQLNRLIHLVGKDNIGFIENLVRGVWEFDKWNEIQNYSNTYDVKMQKEILNFLESRDIVHASGAKFNIHFKKAFANILKTLSEKTYLAVTDYFSKYEWV